MTCPFIIYWIRWTQLWIGPCLYQSIMDAPNLRDQIPNTKMSHSEIYFWAHPTPQSLNNITLPYQVKWTILGVRFLWNTSSMIQDPGRGQIRVCVNIIDWVRGLWLAPMIIPTNTSRWQLPECSMINSDRQTSSRGFPHFGRLSPPPPQTMWKLCEILSRGKH